MDKFNIVHYTQQLMTEIDPVKRDLLQKVLVEEMVREASLLRPKSQLHKIQSHRGRFN